MKWKETDFNAGIEKITAVLLYGPDAGRVDEYCDTAIKKLEIDKDNLFALDADDFRDKQDALFAESCTPSMFGGRKMVIISGAGDAMTSRIAELIEHSGLCATVLAAKPTGSRRWTVLPRSIFRMSRPMTRRSAASGSWWTI